MIDPKYPVKSITIEGSKQSNLDGECIIDLAEYAETSTGNAEVAYFQLKHSTLRIQKKLTYSDIEKTITGFADRYRAVKKEGGSKRTMSTFTLVTNRQVDSRLRKEFEGIRQGKASTPDFKRKIEKSTQLAGDELRGFCHRLTFIEGEGNYISQKERLHGEMTEYIAGFVDSPEVDHLIALVAERALPQNQPSRHKGEILAEDVLKQIAGKLARGLFPAPPEFEDFSKIVPRDQHGLLIQKVLKNKTPVIIHAAGGVGKSVFAHQLTLPLPNDSLAIVYDCFGGGKYRNESTPRHRPCDALVQIANELAKLGLCNPLLAHSGTAREALFQEFSRRLEQATASQREINHKAKLLIVIDAGDNAEMAAEERSERSFVKALLREPMPTNCQLVILCRTERIGLLDPPSTVTRSALSPFNRKETSAHLRQFFSDASAAEIEEFHRLTSGNPRVQANALGLGKRTLPDILLSLGPSGTSLDDQISAQLDAAISALRDKSPKRTADQMAAICLGLANLPPFIPTAVLAAVAEVEESAIHSFVSDLGRPLHHTDDSVQFRDEPTEFWFRKRFGAKQSQIRSFVKLLAPLAAQYAYVAKALPRLLLLSDELKRLVDLSLTDELLPKDNPIDQRDVRVYRLQFAFKAALKLRHLADAARLAFRAGEEMAGNQRQFELLGQNLDLIPRLQDAHKVEELAYSGTLRGGWLGSDNIYSASLLSNVSDFRGEAQSRLRAARRWLRVYIEDRDKKPKKETPFGRDEDKISHSDILELVWTHYNLYGPKAATHYLLSWSPPTLAFGVGRSFIRRIVDLAKFSDLPKIAGEGAKSPHLIVALTDELSAIGFYPARSTLIATLNALLRTKTRIKKPDSFSYQDVVTPAILSFAEACAAKRLPKRKIRSLLDYYAPPIADRRIAEGYNEQDRSLFVRNAALRSALSSNYEPEPSQICFPPAQPEEKLSYDVEQMRKGVLEAVSALLPWYLVRARFICGDKSVRTVSLESIRAKAKTALYGRYQSNDLLGYEMSLAWFKVLILKHEVSQQDLDFFAQKAIQRPDIKFKFTDRLSALRSAMRLSHLSKLRDVLENSCQITMKSPDGTPEENSAYYIELSRAVLPQSVDDSATYFDMAVEAVSKFGDEMVNRWEAVVSVARRAAAGNADHRHLTYRFIQCAEMIGEHVAREKYWDSNEVFNIALELHAPSAFAGLSRWRDRAVGHFPWQLNALALKAMENQTISSSTGWSLSGFLGCYGSTAFAVACIRAEKTRPGRERLLDQVIDALELNGTETKSWKTLLETASELRLNQTRIKKIIADQITKSPLENSAPSDALLSVRQEKERKNGIYKNQLRGIDLTNQTELNRVVGEVQESDPPREFEEFWKEVVQLVPPGQERKLLSALLAADNVDYFQIGYAITAIRSAWATRVAVSHHWNSFLHEVGKRFASAFSDHNRRSYWMQMHPMDQAGGKAFVDGIQNGLSEQLELSNAATFFGFICGIAENLRPEDARQLLEFSLGRFEKHMATEHGDGPWGKWLIPPKNNTEALAGMIWSGLGSPYSSMRWQAAHSVRLLARNGCSKEIACLVRWMLREEAGAFQGKGLPFYNLHARLYLLIAMARAALESPQMFKPHAKVFATTATSGLPHALIQIFAARIADTLERYRPGTYPATMKGRLAKVGKSPFPMTTSRRYNRVFNTPRHIAGMVDTTLSLSFGIDFEPYWFNYLGAAFGTTEKQITELIREVALNVFKIPRDDGYTPDPRRNQWERLGYHKKVTTYHHHSSYPSVDDYRFYYSYHSMMSVAMELLKTMPLVTDGGWDDSDPWGYWIEHHWLTRKDGRWLADRRDPTPTKRREWVHKSTSNEWPWELKPEDFLDLLTRQNPEGFPVCVRGRWSDHKNSYVEDVSINSALIEPEAAEDLASLLRSCRMPGDYALPSYRDDDFEFNETPFPVTGWLFHGEWSDPRLDGFDPHAREIFYPPLEVGPSIAEAMHLRVDPEKRIWVTPDQKGCLLGDIWSDEDITDDNKLCRFGRRLSATLPFLENLCKQMKKTLIFDVRIDRSIHRDYRGSFSDEIGYVPPSHKVFTLGSGGILRDGAKSFAL
jgi:hypothetical protein